MMYLLLGPPCSGKTTLGNALSSEIGLPHIVASSLLSIIDRSVASEDLDALLVDVIMTRLQEPDCSTGFVLDNFPRTAAQAQLLEDALKLTFKRGVSCVLDLEVPIKILESRARDRVVDRATGLPVKLELASLKEASHDNQLAAAEVARSAYRTSSPQLDEVDDQLAAAFDRSLPCGELAQAASGLGEEATMRRSDDVPELFQHRVERYASNIAALRSFYGHRCKALTGTLGNHEVLAQAQRHITRNQMGTHLTVETLAGRQVKLDVSSICTVGQVKELLARDREDFQGVPMQEQRLVTGTRELHDSDALPHNSITLVRQRLEEDVYYDQMRHTLHDLQQQIKSVGFLVSSFSAEVSSPQSWTESDHIEPCGCRTVTKRYVGQDPPEFTIGTKLHEEVYDKVRRCRSELKDIKDKSRKHHYEQESKKMARHQGEMDPFSKFWHSIFFACCMMSAPPTDSNLVELEAHCERVLCQSSELRNKLTTQIMRAATQTNKNRCDTHEPPPPEPGSP